MKHLISTLYFLQLVGSYDATKHDANFLSFKVQFSFPAKGMQISELFTLPFHHAVTKKIPAAIFSKKTTAGI
jgi:hypothetical protein